MAFNYFPNCLSIPYARSSMKLKGDTVPTDSCTKKPAQKKMQNNPPLPNYTKTNTVFTSLALTTGVYPSFSIA